MSSAGRPVAGATAVDVLTEEVRQDLGSVEPDADLPRQVVETDVVELDPLGLDVEDAREMPLEDQSPRCRARPRDVRRRAAPSSRSRPGS